MWHAHPRDNPEGLLAVYFFLFCPTYGPTICTGSSPLRSSESQVGHSKTFYAGELQPEVQPLIPFYIPLSKAIYWQMIPFLIAVNVLSFKDEYITKLGSFRDFFLAIKWIFWPFWVLLQPEMTVFPTLFYTSTYEMPDKGPPFRQSLREFLEYLYYRG